MTKIIHPIRATIAHTDDAVGLEYQLSDYISEYDTCQDAPPIYLPVAGESRHDNCQASADGQARIAAGSTFLLNFERPRGDRLAIFLRSIRYKVYVPEEHGRTVHDIGDDELRLAGLVIFDVNNTSFQVLAELRRIWNERNDGRPFIIAWLKTPCNAEVQLKVEELADRVVEYAAE